MTPSSPTSLPRTLLVCFFVFGVTMCALTIILLTFPGTPLDVVWRVNPQARTSFAEMGWLAFPLMMATGAACAAAATGLAHRRKWGRRIAIAILAVNVIGDAANALLRHDLRTLVGLPIGGIMIWYLVRMRDERPRVDLMPAGPV